MEAQLLRGHLRGVRRNKRVVLGGVADDVKRHGESALTLGLLIYAFGTPLLSLFNTDPEVIANGLIRVSHNMPLYVLFCMQDTFVGQLRGIGYSLLPTITSLSGICLLRVVWLYTAFAASPTLDTLYLSYPVSWAVTLAALVVCYAVVVRKLPKA